MDSDLQRDNDIHLLIIVANEWPFQDPTSTGPGLVMAPGVTVLELSSFHTTDPIQWWKEFLTCCHDAAYAMSKGHGVCVLPSVKNPEAWQEAPWIMCCLMGKLSGYEPTNVLQRIKWGNHVDGLVNGDGPPCPWNRILRPADIAD